MRLRASFRRVLATASRLLSPPARLARDLDVRHLQIGKRVAQDDRLFVGQVAARFFLNHFELIDEHPSEIQIDLRLAGLWIWNLTEEQRCVLSMHHHKFDEALGHLTGLNSFLNFSHTLSLFRGWRTLRFAR